MNEKLMELETLLEGLKIKLSIEEFSHFMIERDLTEAQLDSIVQAFDFIKKKNLRSHSFTNAQGFPRKSGRRSTTSILRMYTERTANV